MKTAVMNYGGGRQSVAIIVLILKGVIERPSRIIIADTGREMPTTFAYLAKFVQPAIAEIGLRVEVIPPRGVYSTTYGDDAKPLIPMFTRERQGDSVVDGKFAAFCSGTWKRDRMVNFLTDTTGGERWIGFAFDEQRRIRRLDGSERDRWRYRFPLAELMIDTKTCTQIVEAYGWPIPSVSRCWLCPHQKNAEWRQLRDGYPDLWELACREDEEQREQDLFRGGLGVWLHHSRQPLRTANLDDAETQTTIRQCSLGACFI